MNMASNEYRTSVYIGTVDGKKVRKTVRAQNQRELDKKVRELKNNVEKGKDLHTNATFGYWAGRWYYDLKEPSGLAPATLTQLRSALKVLNAAFSDVVFKDISFSTFQRFVNNYSKTPLERTGSLPSKRTIKNVVNTFNAVAEYAAESDIPAAVPFKKVAINKNAPEKKRRALTEKEIDHIRETEHPAQIAAMIMIFAGLRRGELVPLRWADIDLDREIINLKRFVLVENSQFVEKNAGKTYSARRIIPLPPVLVDYLKDYRRSGKATSMLVCPKEDGKMHSPSSFRVMWDGYIKLLNYRYGFAEPHELKETTGKRDLPMMIEPFTPHYCRHSYATLLYLQGVPVTTAMQLLGHASIEMTADIYTDLKYAPFDISDTFREELQTIYKVKIA